MTNTHTFSLMGLVAHHVQVRVVAELGTPKFDIIGLPEHAKKETRIRVCNSVIGAEVLEMRIEVTLEPEELPKHGSFYDLPIAIAVLGELGRVKQDALKDWALFGELSFKGDVHGVRGVLPRVMEAKEKGFRKVIVPWENAREAALVDGIEVRAASTIDDVTKFLNGDHNALALVERDGFYPTEKSIEGEFCRVDPAAINAVKLAAAGQHNLLLVGPPGCGKTVLARSLAFLMPPMTAEESLEATAVHSISGRLRETTPRIEDRPLRAPHHTCSGVGLFGGGDPLRPGEVSLAHHGVLFLDYINEFSLNNLNQLREPLEKKKATLYHKSTFVEFPAKFTLVATMQPCPCGYYGDESDSSRCRCTRDRINQHRERIPTWMLNHFDLCVSTSSSNSYPEIKIKDVKSEVSKAVCSLEALTVEDKLDKALSDYGLGTAKKQRILSVARTISAVRQEFPVSTEHVNVALNLHASKYFSDAIRT